MARVDWDTESIAPLQRLEVQQYVVLEYCWASPNVATVSFRQEAAHFL